MELPKAIIVDIDGTLAKMTSERGPFDWMKVQTDLVNPPIRHIVNLYQSAGHEIILFSGRDSVCRELTEQWLSDNLIGYNQLHMRPQGDFRKDAIIKRELFDANVAGKYDIQFVLDDRNQVVDMWRKDLGLTCLQVDYGDF